MSASCAAARDAVACGRLIVVAEGDSRQGEAYTSCAVIGASAPFPRTKAH
jgi:hypothetical protein